MMKELKKKALTRPSLLYLCPVNKQDTLVKLSQSAGWVVDHMPSLQQAKSVLGSGRYSVVLVHFELMCQPDVNPETFVSQAQSLVWIFLTNSEPSTSYLPPGLQHQPNVFMVAIRDQQACKIGAVLSGLINLEQGPEVDADTRLLVDTKSPIIGSSVCMRQLQSAIERLAWVDMPLLIAGEDGTGKALIARNIHSLSKRTSQPFLSLDCRLVSDRQLAENLFGNEVKCGALAKAQNGTVYISDVDLLPKYLQRRLLRYLLEGVIEKGSSLSECRGGARIVASTKADLHAKTRDGSFREDLFYHLHAMNLFVPPLRARGQDIELLAGYLLERLRTQLVASATHISHKAMVAMNQYGWPGNVTELVNRLRRALVVCDQSTIGVDDLGLSEVANPLVKTLEQARQEAEAAVIRAALCRNKGNISKAARELAVSRVTLYRMLNKYDLLLDSNS